MSCEKTEAEKCNGELRPLLGSTGDGFSWEELGNFRVESVTECSPKTGNFLLYPSRNYLYFWTTPDACVTCYSLSIFSETQINTDLKVDGSRWRKLHE